MNNKLIYVGTYNVAARVFDKYLDLKDWLQPNELKQFKKNPDIYVLGFQEVVKLNAKNILISTNQQKVDYWKDNIMENLESFAKNE